MFTNALKPYKTHHDKKDPTETRVWVVINHKALECQRSIDFSTSTLKRLGKKWSLVLCTVYALGDKN